MKKEDADQLIRCVRECWWRVLLLLTIPPSFVVWAIYGWPITVAVEGGMPVWGQVLVTVLGIWSAVYAANQGAKAASRLKEEQRKNATLAVIKAFIDRVEAIVVVVKKPPEKIINELGMVYGPSFMSGSVNAIQALPVLEFQSTKAVTSILELQRLTPFFIQAADALYAGPWGADSHSLKRLESLRNDAEDARRSFKERIITHAQLMQAENRLSDELYSVIDGQRRMLISLAGWIREQAQTLSVELNNKKIIKAQD
ncbi:hypothetical protein I7E32_12885 [Alcaligenes faecalis]|uniref:hypothetical protein n=1 Tax=Alcaligenes faecalis TaxID=511 RepID=UPI0018D0FEBB|nr:hypothetical protein [Alcaligenes faecalis]MBH0311259.1 hypothetical protein [Alcaligenes faecalis]